MVLSNSVINKNFMVVLKRIALIVSLVLFHITSYNFVGKNNRTYDYAHLFFTKIDHFLPFIPGMVWVYISTYFLILLAGIIIKKDKDLYCLVEGIFYTWILTYPFFYFFPAIYPRPSFEVVDFTTKILKYNYLYDVSNNTFPSLHVSLSFVIAFSMLRIRKNNRKILWIFWAVLVAISTVLVKKHFVIDALGGAIIAYASYFLSFKLKLGNNIFAYVKKKYSKKLFHTKSN